MCSRYWADNVAHWGVELEVGGSGGIRGCQLDHFTAAGPWAPPRLLNNED